MTTITQKEDDIFVIRAPGKREGDIIEVSDMEDNVRRVRLTMPMGDQFGFVWADPVHPPTEEDSTDGHFTKPGDEWLIKTKQPHQPGDKVRVTSSKGPQDCTLGECVGENTFRVVRPNHFVRNPDGPNATPKWCVRVYDSGVKEGDTIKVARTNGEPQRKVLLKEVADGVWTVKSAK